MFIENLMMAQSTVALFSYGLIRFFLSTILGYDDYLYLGQTPPGSTPVIFAPGIVSLPNRKEEVITFSADGSEIYYSIEYYPDPKPSLTMFTKYENGKWTKPDTASFSKGRRTSEPFFAFGGNRIYYFANNVKNQKGVLDLCYSSRENDQWGEPISLSSPPNFEAPNYTLHPCVISDTSIYFSSFTGEVCKSAYVDGTYQPTEILPRPINFENVADSECWGDSYVSPNEEFMIFRSNRPGGYGGSDLYITFKSQSDQWTDPENLGAKINSEHDELGGDITPDGKFLTFSRNGDIYWVSATFIKSSKIE